MNHNKPVLGDLRQYGIPFGVLEQSNQFSISTFEYSILKQPTEN